MNEDPSRALNELLSKLEHLGVEDLAEEIRRVVSQGTIEEIEIKPRKYEGKQQPLNPKAAYLLAAEMLIAAIDPTLIRAELNKELSPSSENPVELSWEHDFIEGSRIEPVKGEVVSFPEMKDLDVQALRDAAIKVLQTLDNLNSEE